VGDGTGQNGATDPTAATSPVPLPAASLYAEYAFLIAGGIATGDLHRACADAEATGITPHWRLVSNGVLTAQRYIDLLEAEISRHIQRRPGQRTEIVDGMSGHPSQIAATAAQVRARGNAPLILLRQQIDWNEAPHSRKLRAEMAANGLKRRHPELSAGTPFATWQLFSIPVLIGTAAGGLIVMPATTLAVLGGAVAIPFLFVVGLRLLSLLIAMRLPPLYRQVPRLADAELPRYTVMVPLFREAEILADTVEALLRLDYPSGKLDVLIILESIDQETQAALRTLPLPPHMRAIIVPDQEPRTKPKALNYALRLSQGDYVVVYDAEDDPDPDQLRRAVAAFRRGGPGLMCMQGRLAMDNPEPGWIARQFMLEYAALFDAMLPALARLGLPVPLGGTSNHFPRRVLEDLGGWDAWNVTEDADLGIRIARRGGRVEVLDSTTYEVAPEELGIWIKQRTRWLKGFMQTWLVHMRRPGRLWSELGPLGFLGFNAFLGGIVLSALINPIFLGLLVYEAVTGNLMALPDTLLGVTVMTLALFNFAGGYAGGIGIAGLAASRRGMAGLLPRLALMPLYWVLISVAAYRAALQLVTNPYLWEKTPHARRAPNTRERRRKPNSES
jgi:glycosyltransferase XagB